MEEGGRLGADRSCVGHEAHTRGLQLLLGVVQVGFIVQGVRVKQVHLFPPPQHREVLLSVGGSLDCITTGSGPKDTQN